MGVTGGVTSGCYRVAMTAEEILETLWGYSSDSARLAEVDEMVRGLADERQRLCERLRWAPRINMVVNGVPLHVSDRVVWTRRFLDIDVPGSWPSRYARAYDCAGGILAGLVGVVFYSGDEPAGGRCVYHSTWDEAREAAFGFATDNSSPA